MVLSWEETQLLRELLLGYLPDLTTRMQSWTARQLMDVAMKSYKSAHQVAHTRTMSQQYQHPTDRLRASKEQSVERCSGRQIRVDQSPTVFRPWVEKETVESVESMGDNLSLNSFNLSNSPPQTPSSPLDKLCMDCSSSIVIDSLPKTSRVKKAKEPVSQLNFRPNIVRKTNAAKSPETYNRTSEKSHHSSSSCLSTSQTITINPCHKDHGTHKPHRSHRV